MSDRDAQSRLGSGRDRTTDGDRNLTGGAERDPLLGLLETGVCRLDADGAVVEVNGAFLETLGRERSALLGEALSAFVVADDRPRLSAVLSWYDSENATDGVRFDAVRARFVTGDGERLARELRLDAARPAAAGRTVAVLGEPADDGSIDASPDLPGLVDDLPAMAYRCRDPGGTPDVVTDGSVDVAGYDPEALESGAVGWRDDVVHPEDRDRVRGAVREAVTRGDSFATAYRIRPAGGGTRRVNEYGRAVRGPDGEPVAIDGVVVDATDRTAAGDPADGTGERRGGDDEFAAIVSRISAGVVRQPTRDEIERFVCDRLAAVDAVAFAWIGGIDSRSEEVTLRAEAGVEEYLDGTGIEFREEGRGGPTGRAVRTGEPQVVSDVRADPEYEHRREHASEHGYRSAVAVPISHEDTRYGVLNVYAGRPNAFAGERRAMVDGLGRTVGHAIAALERKRALTNDEMVELELRLRDLPSAFDLPDADGEIRFERAIPLEGGEYLEYGTATPEMVETLRLLPDRLDFVDELHVREETDARVRFESRLSEPPLSCIMARRGSRLTEAVVRDGDYHIVVQLSPGTDVRRVLRTVRESYPDVEFVSQRQVSEPSPRPGTLGTSVLGELTTRQRTVIESAYFAGFFEWPRGATGEEVAESLDIAGSTFHQHLRKAQGTVLEQLLSEVAVSS
ncbi:bacterio-opsin activator domain-containing protein [Halorarum halobium]|uniref:bacterio-opsin activator domain-containing protein n=1 Tax=Halorarum halobium TaxID=3075121 RepID=UPI0028A8EBBC|nr:bacterio-opsin activator domain-containing protein [Halobaculum sp. XH14]